MPCKLAFLLPLEFILYNHRDLQLSFCKFNIYLGIFLFTATSRMALGPNHPPIKWVPGALSLEIKWLGHEADHSPPSSAEVKE
jgi:hypothetical protein